MAMPNIMQGIGFWHVAVCLQACLYPKRVSFLSPLISSRHAPRPIAFQRVVQTLGIMDDGILVRDLSMPASPIFPTLGFYIFLFV
jgi:hypothetical protein